MTKWELKGKRALITGGTRGIGKAIAEEFLALGAEVIIVARGGQELDALVRLWQAEGRAVSGVAADVSKAGDREKIGTAVAERWGGLEILVNNAGMNIRKKLAEYEEEEYRLVLEVNLFSAVALCRLCLPFLRRGTGASVVNIASVAGSVDVQSGAPYGMSKAALIQLNRNLAAEWAEFGIRVNSLSPWYTDTPLVSTVLSQPERMQRIVERTPMNRVAQASEVAGAAAFLAMDKASYITGQNIAIDGGMLVKGL
ncbi:SDR family oxidoreductase [Puia dinghuensis]|uniref:Tropinone reductase n=1 Tax=Puia dinghuensis TaxID=1792502 RepID=A0A8J2UDT1_9BACT|nr:SDR family oxidoreductase [Puia dinghuensis]GGB03818.1 tropinone reductase [Puia dinghuensis]